MQFALNSDAAKKHALDVIGCLDPRDNWIVTIDPLKRKRSNPQNRLYWAWVRVLSRHYGYTDEDLHEILAERFLGVNEVEFKGRKYLVRRSTKKLTKEQFTEYLEKVMALAISEGLRLPV